MKRFKDFKDFPGGPYIVRNSRGTYKRPDQGPVWIAKCIFAAAVVIILTSIIQDVVPWFYLWR